MSARDIANACASLIGLADDSSQSFPGTAFLIDAQLALTAAHLVRNREYVALRFPSKTVNAKTIRIDHEADLALLRVDGIVEDVTPLGYTLDATPGDNCHIYGFPIFLGGSGVLIQAKIEGTTFPKDADQRPSLLISSPHFVAREAYIGVSGAPVVIGNSVVGLVSRSYQDPGSKDGLGFLGAVPISEILSVLPDDALRRFRKSAQPVREIEFPSILVLSALDEELDYLLDMDLGWSDPRVQEDGITFRKGYLQPGVEIIATSAQGMGLTSTAILAAKP